MARLWELFGRAAVRGPGASATERPGLRVGDGVVLVLGDDEVRHRVTVDGVDGDRVQVRTPAGTSTPAAPAGPVRLESATRAGLRAAHGSLAAVRDLPHAGTVWTIVIDHVEVSDRRLAVRIPVSVPIRLSVGRRWHEGWTFDVSTSGLRMVLSDGAPVDVGDTLDVGFAVPPAGAVTSSVSVVRVERRDGSTRRPAQLVVGAIFLGDDPDRDAALAAFVTSRGG